IGRRYRRTVGTSLALLPLAALTACGGGGVPIAKAGSGKGTITVWAHQGQVNEDTALQEAGKSFNGSPSTVRAELKLIPGNDYTKNITATEPSELPDVMEFDGPTLANFVYNGKLTPLSSYISDRTLANVTDAIKLQGTVDGRLYGLGTYDAGL